MSFNFFALAAIVAAQIATAVFLYRMRVIAHWQAGDFVVLLLPHLIALVLGVLALHRTKAFVARRVALALAITAVATYVSFLISFNLYGTYNLTTTQGGLTSLTS